MAPDEPSMEEIFIDPEYAVTHPDEVVLKLAFNEKGDLGLITSHQEVANEPLFVGVSLIANEVWLCKTPLAVKAALNVGALQNISRIFTDIARPQLPLPDHLNAIIFSREDEDPQKGYSPGLGGIADLIRMLGHIRGSSIEREEDEGKSYFGQPDFNLPRSFNFDMDSFLESFDAGDEEDPDSDDDDLPEQPFNNPEDL
jgi:hypothetical protein